MPGTFAALDSGFPNLNGGDSTENKLRAIQDYLYQLLEQLRYTLNNLSVDNFNEQEVTGWLGETITEPIKAVIADEEAHLVTLIDVTAGRILLQVSSDLADSWASGKTYKQYDIVKLTTPENPQPGEDITAVAYYQVKEGKGHTSSNSNKPGTTGGAEYWDSIPAASVSSSRFTQTANEIAMIVQKTGVNSLGVNETLYSRIDMTAGEIKSTVASATKQYDTTGINVTKYGYGAPSGTAASGTIYLDQNTGYYYTSNGSTWTRSANPLPLITTTLGSVIDQLPGEIMMDVHREYAIAWSSNVQYKAGDVVKIETTVSNTTTLAFYVCDANHTSSNTNKPGTTGGASFWHSVPSADVAHSRFDMTADAVRTEVGRATGEESRIEQKADDINLSVTGAAAQEWAAGTAYSKGDVVKRTTRGSNGNITSIVYYKAKSAHTSSNSNKPPNATWWEVTTAPNVRSMIDMDINGITLSYDNTGVTDNNTAYVKIGKDGVDIGGSKIKMTNVEADTVKANWVYAGEISADQITTGTLDAGNVVLSDLFTTKAKAGGNDYNCGTIGGVVYPHGGQYVPLIEVASNDGNHVIEIGDEEIRILSRDAQTQHSVEVVIGPDEITITKRTPSPKTYNLLALLDQI